MKNTVSAASGAALRFLQGSGEMAALTRAHNWTGTALGPVEEWPQSLRTTVGILLRSKFPMFLWWGPELIQFYNDAFRPSLGNDGRHPTALGSRGEDCWPEVWPTIHPLIEGVLQTGEAHWSENQLIPIYRNGRMENVWWTFCYSAVPDDEGRTAGVLVTCSEATEHVARLAKLEESEARFRSLIEESPVATCLFTGRDMVIEIANDTIIDIWGKGRSVMGKPLAEAVPELEGQPFLQLLDNVFTTGETYTAVAAPATLVVNGVPGLYYFDYTFKAVRNAGGDVYGVMDTAVDVTEKVLGRRAIEKAEEAARLAIEAAELGTYEWNVQTGHLEASERFYKIWGAAPGLPRKHLASLIHPDDRAAREEAHRTALRTGHLSYEARVRPEGEPLRWIRATGRVRYAATGAPAVMQGVVQDITEEKAFAAELEAQVAERTAALRQAQANLRDAVAYQQALINKFVTALVAIEPVYEDGVIVDFRFKMVNAAYSAYSGRSPQETVGKRVTEIFPEWVKTDPFWWYIETYETGQPQRHDLHYNVDGFDIHLTTDVSKMGPEVVVHFTDFTELKKLQFDLLQKIKELERSNVQLEEFAHAASHDLKEPIRKIQFFTERLKGQLAEACRPEDEAIFGRIESASQRMGALIDDLLLFSHVSQRPHDKEDVDLTQKLARVLEDLELDLEQKGAVVQADRLPVVKGHRRQLQQLFQNLISNAVKYSKSGVPPRIRITATSVSGAGVDGLAPESRYCLIRFADNGIGFEQADAVKIFQMFQRLHGRHEYSGTGIGLSIVKKVAENHNGAVQAEGVPGEGAVFSVWLPCEE